MDLHSPFVIRNNGLLEIIRGVLTRCYLMEANRGMEDLGKSVVCGPFSVHDIIRFGRVKLQRYKEAVEALVQTTCRGFGRIVDASTDVDGTVDMVRWR